MRIEISPSILSADKTKLQQEVEEVDPYCTTLHVDIMDGKFVPPTTFSAKEIKNINSRAKKFVHLMVENPEDHAIADFADAGADILAIHMEACMDFKQAVQKIKDLNIKPAIAINPPTPIEDILPYLDLVDTVLVMTVNPGWAAQKMIKEVLTKIKQLRQLKPEIDIAVDGGINIDTIKQVKDAGANIFVAGSAIFKKTDRKKAIGELKRALK